jgi:uncharacterized protein involved in response to NO
MTLAVMTLATRGHIGRPIVSTPATTIIYCAIIVSAVARITASLLEGAYWDLLVSAAVAWIMAFAGFVVVYGPMLCRKRYPDSPA